MTPSGATERSARATIPIFRWNAQGVNLLIIILGIVAAYFMTIQSLKLELAAKAEATLVAALDNKLSAMEVRLREGVVGRDQFYRFSADTEARLIRIEEYLTVMSGENLGKN